MSTQASLGAAALEHKDFSSAIKHYTSALSEFPTSPDYFIKRSTAYQRSSPPNYDLAFQDAERAVYYAQQRGKRELIAMAHMRRGIALFGLKRWADATQCFEWAKKKNEKEQGLQIWQKKAEAELQKAREAGGEEEVTVVEIPELRSDLGVQETLKPNALDDAANERTQETAAEQEIKKPEGVQTPADKIRHEWYQTSDTVVVTLLAKGVPKEKTTVDIHERSVSISFSMPTSSTYDFSLDPLFAPIDPIQSKMIIMSTKVEFVLKKSTPGQKWHALESTERIQDNNTADSNTDASSDAVKRAVLGASSPLSNTTASSSTAPAYPTSSRTGPKDWDKLAADLTKKPKSKNHSNPTDSSNQQNNPRSENDAEEQEEEEVDEDEEGGDPVNGFFKKLYANADSDTRRAMMKSYQESNGTALSTNWAEVGKGKVETSPPEGMEARKWDD